jgi:hypothetical protein
MSSVPDAAIALSPVVAGIEGASDFEIGPETAGFAVNS